MMFREGADVEACKKELEINALSTTIAGLKSDVRTIFKRVDEQLALSKAVYELVAEIKVMNEKLQNLSDKQEAMSKELEALKAQPARRWEDIVKAVIASAISGLVVFVLAKIGLS